MTVIDVGAAAALESEAAEYPDERGEILLEAAAAWLRAGEVARGTALLAELIDAGGEDGCYGRIDLAEHLLGADQIDAGYAQLAILARDPALHSGHCGMVAELLVEWEDLDGALRWYDRLVARLTPEEVEDLRGPAGWLHLAAVWLRGRRHVRRALGLPSDAMDEIVPRSPLDPPVDLDDVREHLDAGRRPPRELRILTFQRAERSQACRRWPEVYPETDEEYYPAVERRWRELAERGVPTIRLIPVSVAGLVEFAECTGGSPTDSGVKSQYVATVPGPQTICWPPRRNASCWCGSGVKYKKCCGRPASEAQRADGLTGGEAR